MWIWSLAPDFRLPQLLTLRPVEVAGAQIPIKSGKQGEGAYFNRERMPLGILGMEASFLGENEERLKREREISACSLGKETGGF